MLQGNALEKREISVNPILTRFRAINIVGKSNYKKII